MTLGDFEELGILLALVPPNSLRVAASSQPITDDQRALITEYFPQLVAELRARGVTLIDAGLLKGFERF